MNSSGKGSQVLASTKLQGFWAPGPLPGLNELLAAAKRGRGRVSGRGAQWNGYAALKSRWQRTLSGWIRAARLVPVPSGVSVWLWFEWWEPTRRRDPDNVAAGGRKLLLDALVATGVLLGDGWTVVAGWTDRFHVGHPAGVRVTIIPARHARSAADSAHTAGIGSSANPVVSGRAAT